MCPSVDGRRKPCVVFLFWYLGFLDFFTDVTETFLTLLFFYVTVLLSVVQLFFLAGVRGSLFTWWQWTLLLHWSHSIAGNKDNNNNEIIMYTAMFFLPQLCGFSANYLHVVTDCYELQVPRAQHFPDSSPVFVCCPRGWWHNVVWLFSLQTPIKTYTYSQTELFWCLAVWNSKTKVQFLLPRHSKLLLQTNRTIIRSVRNF